MCGGDPAIKGVIQRSTFSQTQSSVPIPFFTRGIFAVGAVVFVAVAVVVVSDVPVVFVGCCG